MQTPLLKLESEQGWHLSCLLPDFGGRDAGRECCGLCGASLGGIDWPQQEGQDPSTANPANAKGPQGTCRGQRTVPQSNPGKA